MSDDELGRFDVRKLSESQKEELLNKLKSDESICLIFNPESVYAQALLLDRLYYHTIYSDIFLNKMVENVEGSVFNHSVVEFFLDLFYRKSNSLIEDIFIGLDLEIDKSSSQQFVDAIERRGPLTSLLVGRAFAIASEILIDVKKRKESNKEKFPEIIMPLMTNAPGKALNEKQEFLKFLESQPKGEHDVVLSVYRSSMPNQEESSENKTIH